MWPATSPRSIHGVESELNSPVLDPVILHTGDIHEVHFDLIAFLLKVIVLSLADTREYFPSVPKE